MIKNNRKLLLSLTVLLGLFSGCSNSGGSSTESASPQWYARTTVSAVDPDTNTVIAHKTAGVFGQLDESSDGMDRHDIIGIATETATLEVVFLQEGADGDYFSDYHSVKEGHDSWTFQIKNMYNPDRPVDLSNETIRITLEGIYRVDSTELDGSTRYSETLERYDERLQKMTLIDLDKGVAYALSDLPAAVITMDGSHVRTFRWVLGSVEESDFTPLEGPALRAASFRETPQQLFQTAPQKSSRFGLPPQ